MEEAGEVVSAIKTVMIGDDVVLEAECGSANIAYKIEQIPNIIMFKILILQVLHHYDLIICFLISYSTNCELVSLQ